MRKLLADIKGEIDFLYKEAQNFFKYTGNLYHEKYRNDVYSSLTNIKLEELKWEYIQATTDREANFINIFMPAFGGVILAAFISIALALTIEVVDTETGSLKLQMYNDLLSIIIQSHLYLSGLSALVLGYKQFDKYSGAICAVIFVAIMIGVFYFAHSEHYFIGNLYFLALFSAYVTVIISVLLTVNKQKSVVRLEVIKERLRELGAKDIN